MNAQEMLAKINRPLEDKLAETRQIIEQYKDVSCVSWSAGKDSSIMAIEAAKIKPDIPIVMQDNGVEFPETYEHADLLAQQYNLNFIKLKTEKDWFQAMEENPEWMTEEREIAISSTETRKMQVVCCCKTLRLKAMKKYMTDNDLTYEFFGGRFDDLPLMRFATILKNGVVDERFDVKRIFPLAYWTEAQVYEYYQKYNVPLNPLYAQGWISQSCWVCPSISKEGLKQTHPEFYKKRLELEIKYPWFYENKPIGYDSFQGEHYDHHYFMGANPDLPKIISIEKGINIAEKLTNFLKNQRSLNNK